jgi:hypothetical protein
MPSGQKQTHAKQAGVKLQKQERKMLRGKNESRNPRPNTPLLYIKAVKTNSGNPFTQHAVARNGKYQKGRPVLLS